MTALTLVWEYLTGYSVASVGQDGPAEWPPHPARVFMAMAAAWFETVPPQPASAAPEVQEHEAEGNALRWLESLPDPELWLPKFAVEGKRSLVTTYVPINDRAGPSSATVQSAPSLTRSRQSRRFPRIYVGNAPCAFHWPNAQAIDDHRSALDRLCSRVTRIGHSTSLVRMWVADSAAEIEFAPLERWKSTAGVAKYRCRRISSGLLASLPTQTQIPRIETFAELTWKIEDAQRLAATAKGSRDPAAKGNANQAVKQAKEEYKRFVGAAYKKSAPPPSRLRPRVGLWAGYESLDANGGKPIPDHSVFDTELLVLAHHAGPQVPVSATLQTANALRDLIMKRSGVQPVPSWVSGHKSDGSPNDGPEGHMAVLPLPFAGSDHADGHLLGMAIAFPRGIGRDERGRVFGPLLVDELGAPKTLTLTLGAIGLWTLEKRDWNEQRLTLQPEGWTAEPTGSDTWASVTPVVLDRFPKADRTDPLERSLWEQEVRALVADACLRIGLPAPIHIDIGTTSWHLGVPRAVGKRRRLRGSSLQGVQGDAQLGDGFPSYAAKWAKAPRPQVHVYLQFGARVCGPILIGAGRFRGYGLLKPWSVTR